MRHSILNLSPDLLNQNLPFNKMIYVHLRFYGALFKRCRFYSGSTSQMPGWSELIQDEDKVSFRMMVSRKLLQPSSRHDGDGEYNRNSVSAVKID